jgi:hypothetical protein
MTTKQRLSASVDAEALAAGHKAVSSGRVVNISAWVNQALYRQAEHDRRMQALDEFLAAYEARHGRITDQEIRDASRRARARALVVRGGDSTRPARVQRRRRRAK